MITSFIYMHFVKTEHKFNFEAAKVIDFWAAKKVRLCKEAIFSKPNALSFCIDHTNPSDVLIHGTENPLKELTRAQRGLEVPTPQSSVRAIMR